MKNLIKKCYSETAPQIGSGTKIALNFATEQKADISGSNILVYLTADLIKDARS